MKDFTPVPNEWIDSLADGRLTPPMYAILSYLMRTCTWTTGVWRGEAERVHYGLNRSWSVRQINRYLTRLHECGYVTRKNIPGRRGGYKILLNNYVSVNDSEEQSLRPTKLKDWRDLEGVDVPDDDSELSLTMTVRRLGDVPDDDSEMTSNPDVPNVAPDDTDVPKVPDDQTKQASEPVSQSVIAADAATGCLTSQAVVIARNLYPVAMPKDIDADQLNALVARYPDADWNGLFAWNRTHKPAPLVYRSAEKFLEGVETSLNDFANHDAATCARCKALGKQAKAAASSESASEPKSKANPEGSVATFADLCVECGWEADRCICAKFKAAGAGSGFSHEEAE